MWSHGMPRLQDKNNCMHGKHGSKDQGTETILRYPLRKYYLLNSLTAQYFFVEESRTYTMMQLAGVTLISSSSILPKKNLSSPLSEASRIPIRCLVENASRT